MVCGTSLHRIEFIPFPTKEGRSHRRDSFIGSHSFAAGTRIILGDDMPSNDFRNEDISRTPNCEQVFGEKKSRFENYKLE